MKKLLALAVIGILTIGTSQANMIPIGSQLHGQEAPVLTHNYVTKNAVRPTLKTVIKLTTRHLPIHRYFIEDDDEDELYVVNHPILHRRNHDIVVKQTAEDGVEISDGVRLRLMLARMKAMDAYRRKYPA
jgi:hypothetical protein